MSRIDELIAEFCPAGVPFRVLSEVTTRATNVRWREAGETEFRYIDLTSVDRITRRIGDAATVVASNAPSRAQQIVHAGDVIFATTRPAQMRWAVIPPEYHGQIASTGFCVLRPDTSAVLTSFLAHLLGTDEFRRYVESNQTEGNYPSIPDGRVRAFRIPVPPLEVQREIVRILDTFTALEAELEAALEAELEARRRQYEHYRESLVSKIRFSSCEWVPLSTIVSIRTGSKPDSVAEVGPVPYVNAGSEPSGFTNESNTSGGVITIPSRGQGGAGHVGFQDVAFWCGPLCYRIDSTTPFVVNKFLFYYLKNIQEELVALRKVGSIPAVNKSDLEQVRVPMVDVEEQMRIVAALDTLHALMNDLSSGLPTELAARRKQYEHYRDRLLTFEEASA